jgi:antitoxin (DNA-binding transcriptional repressor) of toxin-antitoxin stability system
MKSVTAREAMEQLPKLVAMVEAGEEVIICRGREPVARLTAIRPHARRQRPKVGTITSGPIWYAPNTFAPAGDLTD